MTDIPRNLYPDLNHILTTKKQKTKQMKNKLKTIWHDFWTDPQHYIVLILSVVLISMLIVGGILSIVQTLK
jgi:hypothetical protein